MKITLEDFPKEGEITVLDNVTQFVLACTDRALGQQYHWGYGHLNGLIGMLRTVELDLLDQKAKINGSVRAD